MNANCIRFSESCLWRSLLPGGFALAVLAAAALPAAGSLVLLSDSFDDGERVTQNLPDSAQWFNRRAAGELFVSDNKLKTGTNTTGFWAHIAPSGEPVTLVVGDWIEMSAEISGDGTFTAARDLGLGWGLFDSQGTRDVADNSGNPGQRADDTGYLVWTNPGRDHAAASRVSRAGTGDDHFISRTDLQTFPAFDWGATPQIVSLRLTRTGESEMTLEAAIGGTSMSGAVIDAAATDFTFDTVSFFFDNRVFSPGSGALQVDDVIVTMIPEPGVVAPLLTLLIVTARRRRRAPRMDVTT